MSTVKIIECPRDAWQGLPVEMPPDVKAGYLRKLVAAGFKHIDAVSFVSPAAVPQMANSEHVLAMLDAPTDVEVIGIVVNAMGAERAIKTGKVSTLGFPFSISAEFLRRNQKQTPQQALEMLRTIAARAKAANIDVVVYISMAFGNPYGEPWSIKTLTDAIGPLVETGVKQISLSDTVGLATSAQIAPMLTRVLATSKGVEVGVHLHARPAEAPAKIRAAFEAGCRRFDSALTGLGGCPFAQDELVGNVATEMLLAELAEVGADLPPLHSLDELIRMNAEIATQFGIGRQRAVLAR
jgi:hydroxymethylglutaryl-CoA lyase